MKQNNFFLMVALVWSIPAFSQGYSKECTEFPDKLEKCEKYECLITHPFTGEKMKNQIFGKKGDKCHYVQQMPNNGKMECLFSESMVSALVQYGREASKAKTQTVEVKASIEAKGSLSEAKPKVKEKVKTTYKQDGKEIKNPWEEALNNGQCKILGYEGLN